MTQILLTATVILFALACGLTAGNVFRARQRRLQTRQLLQLPHIQNARES